MRQRIHYTCVHIDEFNGHANQSFDSSIQLNGDKRYNKHHHRQNT